MTGRTWTIRTGYAADLPAVECIERASFGDPWSALALRQELAASPLRLPLVAVDGGRVVGFLMAWRGADQLHILNLAVDPQQRRRGIAAGLLDAALAEARRCRLCEVTLEVRPGNMEALRLYRSRGFRQTGRRPGYYADTGEDALILTLDLPGEATG